MSPLIMKTCEMFARFGFSVELVVPRRSNREFADKDPFEYHGVARNFIIRRIPALDFLRAIPAGKFSFPLLLFTFNVSLFFYFLFRGLPKDAILYFHDLRDSPLLFFFGRPAFLEVHDFYKSSWRALNNFCFRRIRGFIVTNRLKMDDLANGFAVPRERMLHQPNAVDIKMFSISISQRDARERLSLPLDHKIILYTGHLFDWKGVDTLFDAYRFLASGEIIYFVGGTDEDIKRFKVKSEKLKSENVVVVGRRPHAEIPLWLRAADVLVLPNTARDQASKFETSPVKLFEYMASARPIVASDLPSIRNVVSDDMVWFAAPDDPRAITEAIHRVFTDREGAARRGEAAGREVLKYSWENRTRAIVRFIQAVLDET